MCEPTYPVLRSADVLSFHPPLAASDAVQVGRELRNNRGELLSRFRDFFAGSTDVSNVEVLSPNAVRVRLAPVTIDYSPIDMLWRSTPIQFRPCFTVSSGDRKAKTWIRLNCGEPQTSKQAVTDFFNWSEEMCEGIQEVARTFYQDTLVRVVADRRLKKTYRLSIRMATTSKEDFDKQVEGGFRGASEVTRGGLYRLLTSSVEAEYGVPAAGLVGDEKARLVGFQYPHRAQPILGVSPISLESHQADSHDDYRALCLEQHDDREMRIVGLAYQNENVENFSHSAAHIVSGEISFEVGNRF